MDPVSTTRRWIHAFKDEAARLVAGRRGLARTVNGMTFRVHPDTRARFAGTYDPGAGRALAERVRPGQEVWNVGANVGVYVLQLARLVGPTGHVVAFEPAPVAADLLWRNVVLNGFADRVTLIRAAAGENTGEIEFFVDGASPLGRAGQANPLLERTAAVRVPVVTLDQVALDRGRIPDAIVMDIEGFEVAALRASSSLLTGLGPVRPWLIVELHPDAWSWSGHDRAQLQRVLEGSHLRVVPLSGQGDPLGEYGQVLIEPAD
jgi:FkbM family methyltransferase